MNTKNYTIEFFFGRPKKIAPGVRKWPFLAKNIKFWPKMAIFSGPKIFKKHLFLFFVHFRPLLIVFNENEKNWPSFGPFLAPFGPLSPQCTQSSARTREQAPLAFGRKCQSFFDFGQTQNASSSFFQHVTYIFFFLSDIFLKFSIRIKLFKQFDLFSILVHLITVLY